MRLFARTPSPLSLEPSTPPPACAPPGGSQKTAGPTARRPRLRHGAPPFFECWAVIRENREPPKLRFCTLTGAHLRYSAAPGHRVMPSSLLVYGAVVDDHPSHRIVIRRTSTRTRLVLHPDARDDHRAFLHELRRAATRAVRADYTFQHDLRQAAFGRVSCARRTRSSAATPPELVAVKLACKPRLHPRHVACARKEAIVLLSMPEHPNIVRIADVYESPRTVYLVTHAHAAHTATLCELVARRGALCEAEVASLITGLLHALVHLRACKVVHRLICPENVLVQPSPTCPRPPYATPAPTVGTPVLVNFETAVSGVDADDWACVLRLFPDGPWGLRHAAYLAPEVAAGAVGSYEQDVWSLGIVMHYLLVGYTPFEFETDIETVEQLTALVADARGMPSFSGPLWRGVTSIAKHLCASMLHADPRFRVTADSALKHPWLNM